MSNKYGALLTSVAFFFWWGEKVSTSLQASSVCLQDNKNLAGFIYVTDSLWVGCFSFYLTPFYKCKIWFEFRFSSTSVVLPRANNFIQNLSLVSSSSFSNCFVIKSILLGKYGG